VREMSHQGELRARPAGRESGTSLPWKRTDEVPFRWRVRMVCKRTRARFPPALSPAKTILEGGTGEWSEPGGGERRDR